MVRWLVAAGALALVAASGAQAQMKGLSAVAKVARNHSFDFRIESDTGGDVPLALPSNLLPRKQIGSNAAIGVGMVGAYQRRRSGNLRPGEPPLASRRPAVTFSLKF